ncbi:MAG: hypothetical protein U9Q83_01465 [Bacteroidota bacterium]|nr:hypothetical protein [Bacteroidota bacterium]
MIFVGSYLRRATLGRYFATLNSINSYSSSFVEIYSDNIKVIPNLWCFLNSTLGFLISEVSGRVNLGGGMLKAEATDLKTFPLLYNFNKENEINNIMDKSKSIEAISVIKLLDTPIHIKIDDIVFEYFNINSKDRETIKSIFINLVNKREKKSKS